MGLVPGAYVVDSSLPGSYVSSFWVSFDNHEAIHAESTNQNALVSSASGDGMSAILGTGTGDDGHAVSGSYSGVSTSCSAGDVECASAVYADASGNGYGIYAHAVNSASNWDLYDYNNSANSPGTYPNGIYTNGALTVDGYATFSGGKSG